MRQLFVLSLLVMAVVAAGKKCKAPKWQLTMKVVAGIASEDETDPLIFDPFALWNSQAPYNEDNKLAQKLDNSFKGHYKSKLMLNWARRHIQEVKVALLDDKGKELLSLVFDAEGSDNVNWFTKERLLDWPWDDLFLEPRNYFSVEGHGGSLNRRWFINSQYSGCNDIGWLMIGGRKPSRCPWEQGVRPMIKYSKGKTLKHWIDADNASIFAIFVRTKCPY